MRRKMMWNPIVRCSKEEREENKKEERKEKEDGNFHYHAHTRVG